MINLITGRTIDPINLQPEDIDAEAAIHALSILNRYGGHTVAPYSVAEHTYHLITHVPYHLRRAALIHDFSEGLGFVDLVRPVKRQIPQYEAFEHEAQRRIAKHFKVSRDDLEEVHHYDQEICQDEMMQVFKKPVDIGLKGLGVRVNFWSWARTRLMTQARSIRVLA